MSDRFHRADGPDEFRELLENLRNADGDWERQRLLNKIGNSVVRNGMPVDDDEEPEVATAMLEAVCAVMRAHGVHAGVARKGLRMLRMLAERNVAVGTPDEIEAVVLALRLHGLLDMGLQDSARGVLKRWDRLRLFTAESVWVDEALEVARQFQAQPASASKHENILDCLHKLRFHAEWALMSIEQIGRLTAPVAQFAVWCMQNFAPDTPANRYLGETACRVLFNQAAGCMQDDDDRLLETGRRHLVNLGVEPLWTRFSVGSDSDEVDFEWLAARLQPAPAPSDKRGRAAGGSA